MAYREILTKRPWRRITPDHYMSQASNGDEFTPSEDFGGYIVTQSDFLRELHPSGHLIHDHKHYPNIFRKAVLENVDSETGETTTTTRFYEEMVPRIAFAFQKLISLKQCIHLCGNDVQFDPTKAELSSAEEKSIQLFRNGWLEKDMEVAFYKLAKSVKNTGDGAVVGFMNGNKFDWQILTFEKGDRLFPKYDHSGRLELFARTFIDYDENSNEKVRWVEIWDNKNLTRMKSAASSDNEETQMTFYDKYKIDGYELVEQSPHGFDFVPVAYMRDENGPSWSDTQDLIDEYELSFSQMAHNNKTFGEPIMVFKGDDINCVPDDLSGSIKTIDMDSESDVKYLEGQSASESYMKQLDTLYKMIYETASVVIPPELKSGDLPAAALKILYSPAYEKATEDCHLFSDVLSMLVNLFKHGYGIETGNFITFRNLPLKWWLKPYVHVNWTATVTDIVQCVQNKILSKQTATERISEYSTPDEFQRLLNEQEQEVATQLEQTLLQQKKQAELSAQFADTDENAKKTEE